MRPSTRHLTAGLLLAAGAAGAADLPPEVGSGYDAKRLATATQEMVVAANPLAAGAGAAILAKGGSAVDAAITTQLVLTLVEPQSSGLGGGGFLLVFDPKEGALRTFDGREKAPLAATGEDLLDASGTPLAFPVAQASGRSVGVPGTPMLLHEAHRRYGTLPWEAVVQPAIDLARSGFPISNRLAISIAEQRCDPLKTDTGGVICRNAAARAYFLRADGTPRAAGEMLANPALAETLEAYKTDGAGVFYAGPIAADIVAAARLAPGPESRLDLADFAAYRIAERPPVCVGYRGHKVCGMGPPSSGGIALGQMLGILEGFDLKAAGVATPESVHLFTQANRLAFADRGAYLGDGDFVTVNVKGLLDPFYLAARRALIDPGRDMGVAQPGVPPRQTGRFGQGLTPDRSGTSHMSIVDKNGMVVSFTTTIESGFGAGRFVRGYLLNNELTDFSFTPVDPASKLPVANRIEGGKRPRSSMSPTIIFDAAGKVRYVTGSPGGSQIIAWVTQTVVAMVDWGLDPQQAVSLPHWVNNNASATALEQGTSAETLAPALAEKGHALSKTVQTSGLSAIVLRPDGRIEGGADPRRENLAVGR